VVLAAAGVESTWWAYLLLFVAVTASWAGVPFVGSAGAGAAGLAASQGRLDLALVIAIVTLAGEAGGLIGYAIGSRWGRELFERPGKSQERRQKLLDRGERAYGRWGRAAVFFTPAIISGTAKMRHGQFVLWNLLASTAVRPGRDSEFLWDWKARDRPQLSERRRHPSPRDGSRGSRDPLHAASSTATDLAGSSGGERSARGKWGRTHPRRSGAVGLWEE